MGYEDKYIVSIIEHGRFLWVLHKQPTIALPFLVDPKAV